MENKTSLRDLNFKKESIELELKYWEGLIIICQNHCKLDKEKEYLEYRRLNFKALQEIEDKIKEYEEEEERLKKWQEEDNAFKAPELKKEGELKTLKELIWDFPVEDSTDESEKWERRTFAEELKIEAIKWIKKLQTEKILLSNETTVRIEGIWFSSGMLSGASVILKKIFDISEQDLKE